MTRATNRTRLAVLGCALLALAGALPATAAAPAPAPVPGRAAAADPGTGPWVQVPRDRVAAECGLDPALMERAALQMPHTPFTVVRRGKLCWTGGYPGGTTMPYSVNSITKTMGAILVGMVVHRSTLLRDTDPVTEWLTPAERGAINPQARIAHVLAMTATKADLRPGKKGAWAYDTFGDREINTLITVMNKAIAREPERFGGARDVQQFAQRELFGRLGMRDSSWPGESIGASLTSTPEDVARMGLLLLRRGVWAGRRLMSEQYVYRMTHPAFEDTNTGYGYLTYVNADAGWTYSTGTSDRRCTPYGTWPRYPHAPFAESTSDGPGSPFPLPAKHDVGMAGMFGAGGQRASVHRALDLVITVRDEVVSTDTKDPGVFEGHKNVWTKIRPALVAKDPVFKGDEAAFCAAYQRSTHAPDLRDAWSRAASR